MTWANNLQDAAFRGVTFDCRATDDDVSRDLVRHSFPYRDGADIEDLGRGARQFALEALIWGDDYEDALAELIDALDATGVGDLVHPVYGVVWVHVAGYKVHHDADNRDACTVGIQFIEHATAPGYFDQTITIQKAAAIGQQAATARAASTEAMGRNIDQQVAQAGTTVKNKSALDTLRSRMNATSARLLQQAKGVIQSGLDVLAQPRAWATDIVSIADSFLDLQQWVAGDVQQSFMALNRLADLFNFNADDGDPQADVDAHLAATRATLLADAAANVLAIEADAPSMSPPEIEAVANIARTAIDEAIEAARLAYTPADLAAVIEPLRDTALAIQVAARAVIEARPPLVDRVAEAPACLRLLAHLWYGDHERAIELQRLNALATPNFIAHGDVLRAYAT